MAENNELQIVLKLVDEASEPIKTSITGIVQEVKKVEDSGVKAGKSIQAEFKEAGKEIRDFTKTMFLLTAGMALAIKSVNDLSKYDKEAATTMERLNKATVTLSSTLGVLFEPAIKGLTVVLEAFRITIEAALGGFVKLFSFVFEFLAQLPVLFQSISDNIKSLWTGDDPIGVVDAFKRSFDRAVEVANIAADQILGKVEETRSKIDTDRTLEKISIDMKKQEDADLKRKEERAQIEKNLKKQALADTKEVLSQAAEHNKAAAILLRVIAIAESIMNTAVGVTKALSTGNIPLAILIGTIGAAQTALIAAQEFHQGGVIRAHSGLAVDEVPIIAQTGEGILSRAGMNRLGGAGVLNSLNRGGFGGGAGSNITIIIERADLSSDQNIEQVAEQLGFDVERMSRIGRGI